MGCKVLNTSCTPASILALLMAYSQGFQKVDFVLQLLISKVLMVAAVLTAEP